MLSVPERPSERIRLRCPTCRSQNLYVVSVFTDEKAYEVEGGRIVSSYITGAMPEHIRTDAKCNDCGKEWQCRGEAWKDPK